jgi:hypothetical protein
MESEAASTKTSFASLPVELQTQVLTFALPLLKGCQKESRSAIVIFTATTSQTSTMSSAHLYKH